MPEKLKQELLSVIRYWTTVSNDREVREQLWNLYHSVRAVQDPQLAFRQSVRTVGIYTGLLIAGAFLGFLVNALYL